MSESWKTRFSVATRGARHQIGIAVALITIIPAMSVTYVTMGADWAERHRLVAMAAIGFLAAVSILLGYLVMGRYPLNIVRLRRYLEDMVNGKLPEHVRLLQGMDDIPAIERSLTLIVGQLSHQVARMEDELRQIEWLLSRHATPRVWSEAGAARQSAQPAADDRAATAPILSSVGSEMLTDIVGEFLDLVETSAAVFEADGKPSLRLLVSEYSRYLAESATGRQEGGAGGIVLSSTWGEAARLCMRRGQPVDLDCMEGVHLYCVPIIIETETIGAMAFAYGDPPRSEARLRAVAETCGVSAAELESRAAAYETRPTFIVSLARNRILTAAKLTAEIVHRRRVEEELRGHRDHLEELVANRTAELKRANEQLEREVADRRRAERLKDEFVSTVSHELRTPLAVTKEGVSLLLDGIPGPVNEKQTRVLTTARNNIDRLARIINDLLDIAKIEAGRMELKKERVELVGLARQAVANVETLARNKNLTLDVMAPEESFHVLADPDRIVQVLTNLLANAVKFTVQGGITITFGASGGLAECRVNDTGRGIGPDDLPHLFQKFTQFGRKNGAGDRGTGLGLAIVKNIVELHGGTVSAESALEVGTTITFTLPLYTADRALADRIEQRLAAARQLQTDATLVLLDVRPPAEMDIELWQMDFQKIYLSMVESGRLARNSDLMASRAGRQIVIVGEMDRQHEISVCERWCRRIEEDAACILGEAGVHARFGLAHYPADGDRAAVLLDIAEKRLGREV